MVSTRRGTWPGRWRATARRDLADQDRQRRTQIAVVAERNRIAREMHDIVAHNLSVMIALTDGAALTIDRDPARARDAIRQVAETGRAALAEMRDTFTLLRAEAPGEAAARGPKPGLTDVDALLESARSTGLQVTYQLTGSTDGLPTSLQLAVFRMVQEGITNTLKHAPRATWLHISIRRGQEDLRLIVDDNGGPGASVTGFGHGLIGMRERAALHNGRLFAGPTATGWRVSAWVPLRDQPGAGR